MSESSKIISSGELYAAGDDFFINYCFNAIVSCVI
jgi:hypothetical protein